MLFFPCWRWRCGVGRGGGDAGGGHLEEIRVRPDMAALVKHDSGLNGGLLSRRLSARLSFICPSPNKTRARYLIAPAAAGVNRPPPISSLSLRLSGRRFFRLTRRTTCLPMISLASNWHRYDSDRQIHHCARMQFVRSASVFISSRLVKAKKPGHRGSPEHEGM